mmetsp:Transcript_26702/g.56243  ORF Transcript_26702/g.56243 Transcript_26702/m.56243 type:complete len:116 (-) Transcript_26702:1191-1538(-)
MLLSMKSVSMLSYTECLTILTITGSANHWPKYGWKIYSEDNLVEISSLSSGLARRIPVLRKKCSKRRSGNRKSHLRMLPPAGRVSKTAFDAGITSRSNRSHSLVLGFDRCRRRED